MIFVPLHWHGLTAITDRCRDLCRPVTCDVQESAAAAVVTAALSSAKAKRASRDLKLQKPPTEISRDFSHTTASSSSTASCHPDLALPARGLLLIARSAGVRQHGNQTDSLHVYTWGHHCGAVWPGSSVFHTDAPPPQGEPSQPFNRRRATTKLVVSAKSEVCQPALDLP